MSWRSITHNIWWKLGSVTAAVLLWFSIVGEPEVVISRTLPIVYKNLSPDLLIGSDSVDGVRVDLRGPASRLTPEQLSETAVQLDLSSVSGPGEHTFTLSNTDLRVPEGVSFMRAVPSQLRINFSRMLERDVPVQIRIADPPPAGYRVGQQEVTPSIIRIAGPEARVRAIQNAGTDALDLSGVTQTSEIRANTFVADPQVRLVSPPEVVVKITVVQSTSTREPEDLLPKPETSPNLGTKGGVYPPRVVPLKTSETGTKN
jgi:YbbR domain-containing protein